nr:ABC transporter permease [Chromobacterium sp. ASV5]
MTARGWVEAKEAWRLLRQSPLHALMSVLVMACGLAGCLFMGSVLGDMVFRPLPFADGERMMMVSPVRGGVASSDDPMHYQDYQALRREATALQEWRYLTVGLVNLGDGQRLSRLSAARGEARLLEYTGVAPALGRTLSGAPGEAVLGYDVWRQQFGGDERVIGRAVSVDGQPYRVVGVMPPRFGFPFNQQLWLPGEAAERMPGRQQGANLTVIAKLAPGKTLADANAELAGLMARLEAQYPDSNRGLSARALGIKESYMGQDDDSLFVAMLATVGVVLLLSCCNLANLLLARANARSRDTAVRVALGAPWRRLLAQSSWESAIICLAAGALAWLLAWLGVALLNHFLPTFVPDRPPFWWYVTLGPQSLLWLMGLLALTVLVSSVLPAVMILFGRFNLVLRDGVGLLPGRLFARFSQWLVVGELTLSTAVLAVGGVLTLAVFHASRIEYGIQADKLWVAEVKLPARSGAPQALYRQLAAGLAPAGQGVGMISSLPGHFAIGGKATVEGGAARPGGAPSYAGQFADADLVSPIAVYPGTLALMGVQPLAGRAIDARDTETAEKAAVVTDSFVRRYWPGASPAQALGKWVQLDGGARYRVAGVVPHVMQGRPFGVFRERPSVYLSLLQAPSETFSLVQKGDDANALGLAMRAQMARLAPGVALHKPGWLADRLARNGAGLRFFTSLFALFSLVALLIAASGVYAVVANSVSQRTRELGLRSALGASDAQLTRMILRETARRFGLGVGLGVLLAVLPVFKLGAGFGLGNAALLALLAAIALFILLLALAAARLPLRPLLRLSPAQALLYQAQ